LINTPLSPSRSFGHTHGAAELVGDGAAEVTDDEDDEPGVDVDVGCGCGNGNGCGL
jgi:hypothetical protein